jgi:hypothetical protein
MPLNIILDVPAAVEEKLRKENANINEDVKEAYALELFRRGKLTHCELFMVLGLDRFETDVYLKRHNVLECSLTMADIQSDRETLDRVMGKAR